MEITKAAVGVIAVACLAGGAGGAYLATRADSPATAADTRDVLVSRDPAGLVAVDQSEAIIEPSPFEPAAVAPPPPAPRPAARPAPAVSRSAPARPPAPAPVPAPLPEVAPVEPELAPVPVPVIEPPLMATNEPSRWVPAAPAYDELIVPANSVIGLQVETGVSSETARIEDRVVARVTREVRVGDRIAIPAGARLEGEVTEVERGGRMRERARLGVRFTSLVLADGTRVPVATEAIYREGDSPGAESAAKIGGGAIGGAIIGGILGGAKGAAIGSSAGAGAGTAAVLAGGRNPATLQAGAPVTVRIERPIAIVVER